ncbi:MAG: MFS transporter [Pseudomonadota bacterium]
MEAPAAKIHGIGVGVVPLLALAVFINYVDRGNLATAAPLIKDELSLSGVQIGVLLSAFFWTYTPSQLLAGWLAERINAYRTLAIGLAVWALATAATGLASGFVVLVSLRLLLGVGESAAFPCSSKLLAEHLPEHRLGVANGIIGLGLSLGPAFGTFAGGLLMAGLGWRATFLIFGLASLFWLGPWWATTRHASARADATPRAPAPSFRAILKHREAWGASLGHFSANYAFYFVISWLPLYLVKSRGFSLAEMAEIGGLVYVAYAASAGVTGWLTDRWMQRGATANRARKTAAVTCHVVVAFALLACAMGDRTVSVASLFVAAIGFGLNTAGIFAIGQTLAGPVAAGKWIGLQNCVGNLAGIVAPLVTGFVVDRTGQFFWAFVIAAGVALLGVCGWGLIIRRVSPVTWPPLGALALE